MTEYIIAGLAGGTIAGLLSFLGSLLVQKWTIEHETRTEIREWAEKWLEEATALEKDGSVETIKNWGDRGDDMIELYSGKRPTEKFPCGAGDTFQKKASVQIFKREILPELRKLLK